MPLRPGKAKKVIQTNIAELVRAYHETGHIGASKPASLPDAQKIAAAIAYDKARKKGKK